MPPERPFLQNEKVLNVILGSASLRSTTVDEVIPQSRLGESSPES
jgi:hypothetical protein